MEVQGRKTASQGGLRLLSHVHVFNISSAVLQIIGGVIDHHLPQLPDRLVVGLEAGADEFPGSGLVPAVIIDPNIQQAMDAEGQGAHMGPVLSGGPGKAVVKGTGDIFHIGGPALVGSGAA